MPTVLSLQLYQHQVLAIMQIIPRLTRCQGGNNLHKSLRADWETFPPERLAPSTLFKLQEYTYPHNSKISWRGHGQRFDLQKPQAGYEGSDWPWDGFFLITAETMSYKGKILCWYQKGKHNWHSQLICSPLLIMVDELPPPLLPQPISKTARKTAEGCWLLMRFTLLANSFCC